MKEKIKDIKVLGPEDKLIILFSGDFAHSQFEAAANFIDSQQRTLVLDESSFKVFILKKGAKVELKEALNEKLA